MLFVSTRGGEKVTCAEAIVKGLSANGGLFVPETFPQVSAEELEEMLCLSYPERAAKVLIKFLDGYDGGELLSALDSAYSEFEGDDPVPLVKIAEGVYVSELFHGPTCAFKDISLTVLPYLIGKSCEMLGVKEQILILVATSGDAGKAALESFKDVDGVKVMVFYPDDGVSSMQKLQMCTQDGENVNVVAVRGSFDDCQSAVKGILGSDEAAAALKKKGVILSTANSINFGALAPHIACYFSAYLDLVSSEQIEMGQEIDFCVPAGNFGGVIAGYYAKKMGLPVRRLHCASNMNNVFTDFFNKGIYDAGRELYKTMSPSMDILVASDLERLLFEVSGRDGAITADRMEKLKKDGTYTITEKERLKLAEIFDGGFADEDEVVEAVYDLFCDTGYTMDTHTGCAMKVANDWARKNKKDKTKMVIVSTANPYKFPQDVLYAVTGNDVRDSFKGIKRLHAATAMAVPKCLAVLKDKPVRFKATVSKDKMLSEVIKFIGG